MDKSQPRRKTVAFGEEPQKIRPPGAEEALPTNIQSDSSQDDLMGVMLGNLSIQEKIGQGGWGAVYRAQHVKLHHSFAIKVLNNPMQAKKSFVKRFEREARTLVQLQHDNIVRVVDCGTMPTKQSGHYISMEYLDGKSLEQAILDKENFSMTRILSIMEQICSALSYIHKRDIVHRDLKPSNIFLVPQEDGSAKVKLIDFGVATILDEVSLTLTGACIGSPKYMSPEQAEGRAKEVDGRADIYSLGLVLFELLTGRAPFESDNVLLMLRYQAQTPAPRLKDISTQKSWVPELEALIKKTLSKKLTNRPENIEAFWRDCERALQKQEQLEVALEFSPTSSTKTMIAKVFVVAFVVFVVGLGGWWWTSTTSKQQKHTPIRKLIASPPAPIRLEPQKKQPLQKVAKRVIPKRITPKRRPKKRIRRRHRVYKKKNRKKNNKKKKSKFDGQDKL